MLAVQHFTGNRSGLGERRWSSARERTSTAEQLPRTGSTSLCCSEEWQNWYNNVANMHVLTGLKCTSENVQTF